LAFSKYIVEMLLTWQVVEGFARSWSVERLQIRQRRLWLHASAWT